MISSTRKIILRGIVFGAGPSPKSSPLPAAGVGLTALHLLFAVAQFVAASGPRARAAV
jgi:hypothetical protein